MRATRKELAEGLMLLGSIGWLVSAFVVPGQWLEGHIRTEGIVGTVVSTMCLVLAIAVARAPRLGLLVLPLAVVGATCSGYALLILDAASGKSVAIPPGVLRLIVAALLVTAIAAFVGAVKIKRARVLATPPSSSLERTRER